MCREEAQKPQWIKNLSKIYRPDRKFLDGSKMRKDLLRKEVQGSQWIDICREAIELDKKQFFQRGKTHRDECNKQAT